MYLNLYFTCICVYFNRTSLYFHFIFYMYYCNMCNSWILLLIWLLKIICFFFYIGVFYQVFNKRTCYRIGVNSRSGVWRCHATGLHPITSVYIDLLLSKLAYSNEILGFWHQCLRYQRYQNDFCSLDSWKPGLVAILSFIHLKFTFNLYI